MINELDVREMDTIAEIEAVLESFNFSSHIIEDGLKEGAKRVNCPRVAAILIAADERMDWLYENPWWKRT